MTTSDNKDWEMFDKLAEAIGFENLAHELVQAMSTKEANENIKFIAQMHIDKL